MLRIGVLLLLSCTAITAELSPTSTPSSHVHASPRERRFRLLPALHQLRGGTAAVTNAPLGAAPGELTAAPLPAHACEVKAYLLRVGVSPDVGLSEASAKELLAIHGPNKLQVDLGEPLWKLFVAQFDDRLVQILLGVAVLSYTLARLEGEANGWVEPVVILGILLLNAAIGTWQEASAASALDALQKLQPERARCLREGKWQHDFAAAALVPGDIIELRVGDRVPADARLLSLSTTTLSADEGSLTGESMTVSKTLPAVPADARIQDKANLLFAGTVITNGRGLAVVTATGGATEMGKIQQGVQAAKGDEERTPLAQKLDDFGEKLTLAISGICVAVWAINFRNFWQPAFGSPWRGALYYLKVAVALGVAAIPEGLPAVITLCLSLGTRRMAARRVIVRKLPSVETLGCTTVICTDKTGTLTTNQMTVTSLVTVQSDGVQQRVREYEVEGVSYSPAGTVLGLQPSTILGSGFADLAAVCTLCNDAEIGYTDGQFTRVGEPTEAALKVLVEKIGLPNAPSPTTVEASASHYSSLRASEWTRVATLEFSRERKSMSVLCRHRRTNLNSLFVKGAPEGLLPRCDFVRLVDGTTVRMTDEWRRKLRAQFDEMARRPLRCLVLAVKDDELGALGQISTPGVVPASAAPLLADASGFANLESGLTFVGLVGIKDPARPEVAEAIRTCGLAGVRVVMITGDSAQTATAIARDVHIFGQDEAPKGRVFVGGEFFDLPQSQQDKLLTSSNLVFCRAEPQDKQRLLKQLQVLGEVAAMTGDGVNDAPALQQASIGVAMGIAGTEVSKQAADMVLADDNFATIVAAIEEGRSIYANMKAFINFLITCNIGEVMAVFLSTLLGLPEVLGPLHLLWVNLVTDGPPATALGFNPPDPNNMRRPPRGRNDPLISRFTVLRYALCGTYVGAATVGAFMYKYRQMGVPLAKLRSWTQCTQWEGAEVGLAAVGEVAAVACDAFDAHKGKLLPSSVALSTLVAMEMLRALCSVSDTQSLLQKPFWANRWLLGGVTMPVLLHLGVLYTKPLARIFQMAPLSKADWLTVAAFAGPLVLLEELLKLVARVMNIT